jgi:hypothetical protein
MYYNLSSIHSVLRLAPFGPALTQSFDTFVGADGSDVNVTTAARSGTLQQIIEVGVIAAKTMWQFLLLGRRIVRFETTVDHFAERTEPARLASMPIGELRATLGEFMEIRRDKWLDASLADAASMMCYAALERLLRHSKRTGSDTSDAIHTSLLKAIPDVISGEPVHQLWALSRLIRDDRLLNALFELNDASVVLTTIASTPRFAAFRSALPAVPRSVGLSVLGGVDAHEPELQENPAAVIDMCAPTRASMAPPDDIQDAGSGARRRQRVLAELAGRSVWRRMPVPTYAQLVRVLLPWTHAAIRFRERANEAVAALQSVPAHRAGDRR